jgi:hypothetical protein
MHSGSELVAVHKLVVHKLVVIGQPVADKQLDAVAVIITVAVGSTLAHAVAIGI